MLTYRPAPVLQILALYMLDATPRILIIIITFIGLALIGESVSAEATPSHKTETPALGLKPLLRKFESLSKVSYTTGKAPILASVDEDVGCSLRVFQTGGSYHSIFFEGKLNIDGHEQQAKRLDQIFPDYRQPAESKHTYYVAGIYLIDVEMTSGAIEVDSGHTSNAIIKVGGAAGTRVMKVTQYCGC